MERRRVFIPGLYLDYTLGPGVVELRLWALRVTARRVRDRRTGRWKLYFRIIAADHVLIGLDYHPTSACRGRWRPHIHLGECWTLGLCPRPRLYRERRCRRRRGEKR